MAFVILASLAIVLLLFLSTLIALDLNADGGIHWFHDLNILVFILVFLVVGLAAQLRAPAQHVAAMQQVLTAAGGDDHADHRRGAGHDPGHLVQGRDQVLFWGMNVGLFFAPDRVSNILSKLQAADRIEAGRRARDLGHHQRGRRGIQRRHPRGSVARAVHDVGSVAE